MSDKKKKLADALQFLKEEGYIVEVKPPLDWQPWMDRFLPVYRKHKLVKISGRIAGVSPPTVYKYYNHCSRFREQVKEIKPLKVRGRTI